MQYRSSSLAALCGLLLCVAQARADFDAPGDPAPPSSSSSTSANTANHGSRWHWGTEAWVRLGAGAAGNVILYVGHAKPSDYFWWNLGSAIWPGGGGALLALFQEDDGLITNFVKGTWKCQPNDHRSRCAIWVQMHPVRTVHRSHHHRARHHVAHRSTHRHHVHRHHRVAHR